MRITEGLTSVITKSSDDELRVLIAQFIDQVAFTLNGNTEIIGNLKVEIQTAKFNLSGAEIGIQHTLGREAKGYIVIRRSANIAVYDGATSWTPSAVFLRSNGAMTATFLIF